MNINYGIITCEQYGKLQRWLGFLDGLGYASLPDDFRPDYSEAISNIGKILEETKNNEPSQK